MAYAPPPVPPHTHVWGPCEKLPFGGTYARFCTRTDLKCRASIPC
jgi:hypothetical protein